MKTRYVINHIGTNKIFTVLFFKFGNVVKCDNIKYPNTNAVHNNTYYKYQKKFNYKSE